MQNTRYAVRLQTIVFYYGSFWPSYLVIDQKIDNISFAFPAGLQNINGNFDWLLSHPNVILFPKEKKPKTFNLDFYI